MCAATLFDRPEVVTERLGDFNVVYKFKSYTVSTDMYHIMANLSLGIPFFRRTGERREITPEVTNLDFNLIGRKTIDYLSLVVIIYVIT